jgi:hypothetical protein
MVPGPEVPVTDAKVVVSGRKAVLDLLGPGRLRHVTLRARRVSRPGPPTATPPVQHCILRGRSGPFGLSVTRAAVMIAESPTPAPGRRVPDVRALQTSDEVSTGPWADPSGASLGPVSARAAPSSPFLTLYRWSVKHTHVSTCVFSYDSHVTHV